MGEDEVKKRFYETVKDHVITVIRDDGVYRHLRFHRPGTYFDSFYITTWPGYLAMYGDVGSWISTRLEDMFNFYRSKGGRINPGYWAEKVESVDKSAGLEEFSSEKFDSMMRERLGEIADNMIDDCITENIDLEEILERQSKFKELCDIADRSLLGIDDERAARDAVEDFNDECKALLDINFWSDFWEADLKVYTFRFLFFCHAVVYAINMYDEMKAKQAFSDNYLEWSVL